LHYPSPPSLPEAVRAPPGHPWVLLWYERAALLVAGGVLVTLLGIAAWLEPSPLGLGTHQQLGLPPCTMRFLFHIRCPSCGMTTSWAHLMEGNLLGSLKANAGGTLLGLTALLSGPWLVASGLRGRWLWGPPHELAVLAVAAAVVLVTLADWCLRLAMGW
jgi:uncharacterized protein DUF2752